MDIIKNLQNPKAHVHGDYQTRLEALDVNYLDLNAWIHFEDRFSIEHFSELSGETLVQVVYFLCVMNSQAGIASPYGTKITLMNREKLLSLYSKYGNQRQQALKERVFESVCVWMQQNQYISELECQRLLAYSSVDLSSAISLDEMNHTLLKNEIGRYVETRWGK